MSQNQDDLVSIVVPNYNNEKYINSCIDSILSQSHKNIEIIVIDDFSSDNSVEKIEHILKTDSRMILLKNNKNLGVALTREKGIYESQGKWITTLDGDDIFTDSQKLEKEVQLAQQKEKEGVESIIYSGIRFISTDGDIMGKQPGRVIEGDILHNILTRTCLIPRDFLFTKEQYVAVGGYDPNIPIYEDWDLKIRLASKYAYYHSGIEGVGYRRHGSGLSSAPPIQHIKYLNRVFLKNFHLVKNNKYLVLTSFYKLIAKMIRNEIKKTFTKVLSF